MASSSQAAGSSSLAAASLFSVDGMVCAITGGGTGIGLMMAKALAENGAAKVYILGRRLEKLEEAARSVGKPCIVPVVCDVTSKDSLLAAAQKVSEDSGFLNLLICNSGITGPSSPQYESMTVEEYAKPTSYTAMAFLRLLSEGNKKGNVFQKSQVIATSSIAGFNKTSTAGYAYGQSKAACIHLVKQLSVTLPTWDIRANGICPGLYPSEMTMNLDENQSYSWFAPGTATVDKKRIPLQRLGDEKDMGGLILYLTSRAGAYLNGAVVVSDGGRLATFPSTF